MSQEAPPSAWYHQPVWLGLLGLALLLGGWKLSTFEGFSTRDEQQAQELARLRRLAASDPDLRRRLDQVAGPAPYQLAGRLVFLAGLVVFVAAAVQMARRPAAPQEEQKADTPLS